MKCRVIYFVTELCSIGLGKRYYQVNTWHLPDVGFQSSASNTLYDMQVGTAAAGNGVVYLFT